MTHGKPQTSRQLKLAERLIVLLILCIMVGCTDVDSGSSIVGTVKLDGELLASGRVLAVSDSGHSATAKIKPDGTYRVLTREGKGLQPGRYDLAVIAYEEGGSTDPEAPRESIVPRKYTEPKTSGFSVDVEAGKTATKDLDLTSK